MMDIHALYAEITSTYAEKILNWAVRKTGCRADGEDLAQEGAAAGIFGASRAGAAPFP